MSDADAAVDDRPVSDGSSEAGGRVPLVADERGVSVTVGYVLTLAIGALLLSGVVIAVGGVIDGQTQRTVESELSVAGQIAVANVESADRFARAAEADRPESEGTVNVVVEADLPSRVAGRGYRIEIDSETVLVRTDRPDVRVEIPHAATRNVTETTVRGGPIRISYTLADGNSGPGTIEVTER
ncbi:DUF7266 family protein [Halorubrum halophilum]|uniref:DUF7266 family protein n=1 Tax=Halorubrum halophilum TaxID=413816 RepID=UPI001F26CE4D|nr:hypothetical protein [Halorubrum halophilum]